jgi:hypothetical protein
MIIKGTFNFGSLAESTGWQLGIAFLPKSLASLAGRERLQSNLKLVCGQHSRYTETMKLTI